MRICVSIEHPAHVHYFRNAIRLWASRGHRILVVSRDKDITLGLLDLYGIAHSCISRVMGRKAWAFAAEQLIRDWQLWQLAKRFQTDVFIGSSAAITHIGKLLRKPSIIVIDTEHAKAFRSIAVPFATHIVTPSCFQIDLGRRHTRFNGYLELAYLHPNYFVPNILILKQAGLEPYEKYFVIRFVSWEASHDVGQKGFSLAGKRQLVNKLSQIGKVIISSESKLPSEFESYRMPISPIHMHDLLYFSTLYIGEGGTMASEAAVLGTPSIYVNSLTMGYIEELKNEYGLLHRVTIEQEAIDLAVRLAQRKDVREAYKKKRQELLEDKIDVTAWIVNYVEERASLSKWETRPS